MRLELLCRPALALVVYVLERWDEEAAEANEDRDLRNVILKTLVQIILAGNEAGKLAHVEIHCARPVVNRTQPEREKRDTLHFFCLYKLYDLRRKRQDRARNKNYSQQYRHEVYVYQIARVVSGFTALVAWVGPHPRREINRYRVHTDNSI